METDLYRSAALPSIKQTVILAAREGVPIRAIGRIVRQPAGTVRRILHEAQATNQLPLLPPEEWLHLGVLSGRTPSRRDMAKGHPDQDVFDAGEIFGLRPFEACFLMAMVKRPGIVLNHEALQAASLRMEEANESPIRYCARQSSRVRQKLAGFGVDIRNSYHVGYYVTPEHAKKIIDRINDHRRSAFAQVA